MVEKRPEGEVTLRFDLEGAAFREALARHGAMPLPPYIKRPRGGDAARPGRLPDDVRPQRRAPSRRRPPGCISPRRCSIARRARHRWATVTLHVGPGTFLPVKVDDPREHRMHAEWGVVTADDGASGSMRRGAGAAASSRSARRALRLLESAAAESGEVRHFAGETRLFILPGYRFRAIDLLLTNFHLPRSTLLMLVAALAGLDRIKAAYAHAVAQRLPLLLLRRRLPDRTCGAPPLQPLNPRPRVHAKRKRSGSSL